MKLPFTAEQFFGVFSQYNQSVYPMQVVLYALAAVVIFLSIKKIAHADRIINAILSFLWLWMGGMYHLLYFSQINKAAYLFGAVFILQGFLFFYFGVLNNRLSYQFRFDGAGWVGALLTTFALMVYPVLGRMFGHFFPASPTFGLPCPTTIFTFGILVWFNRKMPLSILIIPLLWSLVGFFAAWQLGVHEDTGLLIAGIIAALLIPLRNKKWDVSRLIIP